MLTVEIPETEFYDEVAGEFLVSKKHTLQLEHSLVSLSKWESKWEKPFLTKDSKTTEETLDYIRCMTITQNVDPNVYRAIGNDILEKIRVYIDAPMTATWFAEERGPKGKKEVITAEIIYYWMIALNIPFECQKWHLNRLLTLIRVCNLKNAPPKKMSNRELLTRNRELNLARRKSLQSRG